MSVKTRRIETYRFQSSIFSNGCDVNYNDTWTYYLDLEASFQKGAEELKAVGGCTALHIGAVQGEHGLVEALLQVEGVEVDPQDNYGVTPLYDAARERA